MEIGYYNSSTNTQEEDGVLCCLTRSNQIHPANDLRYPRWIFMVTLEIKGLLSYRFRDTPLNCEPYSAPFRVHMSTFLCIIITPLLHIRRLFFVLYGAFLFRDGNYLPLKSRRPCGYLATHVCFLNLTILLKESVYTMSQTQPSTH